MMDEDSRLPSSSRLIPRAAITPEQKNASLVAGVRVIRAEPVYGGRKRGSTPRLRRCQGSIEVSLGLTR
jgi:hypothetical protein